MASATSHVSDTPENRTHMAGNTPAVLGAYISSGSTAFDTQNESKSSNSMDITLPISNSAAPVIAPASVVRGEILDILENYADFELEEDAMVEETTSSPISEYALPPSFEMPSTISSIQATSLSVLSKQYFDSVPLETRSTTPLQSDAAAQHARTNSLTTPLTPLSIIPDTFGAPVSPSPPPSPSPPHLVPTSVPSPAPVAHIAHASSHFNRAPEFSRATRDDDQSYKMAGVTAATNKPTNDNSFMATQDESHPTLRKIPGPAGHLPPLKGSAHMQEMKQAAKENEALVRASQAPVQHARLLHAQKVEDQTDFRTGAWMQMLCDQDMLPYGSNKLNTSLDWVRRIGWEDAVPSLIVTVKSLRAVEDDYRAILRDPTGSMEGCTISKSVSEKFADFSVGCVLLLKEIAVYTYAKGRSYLVVTPENVVRVWPRTDMSRAELASISHRVYTYNCIYNAVALPPSSRGNVNSVGNIHPNHSAAGGSTQRTMAQIHRFNGATAVYQSSKGAAATTTAGTSTSKARSHNPFDGPPSIRGMTNFASTDD